jgi:hypothetical protein
VHVRACVHACICVRAHACLPVCACVCELGCTTPLLPEARVRARVQWTRPRPADHSWSLLHAGPHGRRTARRPDPAGTRNTPPLPGPLYGARRRRAGRTTTSTDGAAAPPARSRGSHGRREARAAPRSRKDSYTYLNNESLSPSRLAPGDQARGVGPHPQSNRLRAQAGRAPPPVQRRLGTRR